MSPLPRSDWGALRRYDPGRAPTAIDLSDNTNLWGTHPDALEVVRSASAEDLARYPELYSHVLRSAVAERFGVAETCVTTGAGSDDVLDSAFRAAWAPGGAVSYAAPTFSMVEPLARMNSLEPRPVPWATAHADPEALLEGDPAVVYVCRPNNPTGALAPRAWVDALLEARGTRDVLVVLDEAYADFAGETLLSDAPDVPRLLVTRTASKAYGLAGLRVGFAVGRADVVVEVDKSRGPYKLGGLAAAAAAAALRDEAEWMPGIVEACVENRKRLEDALTARGHSFLPSSGNFVLLAAPRGEAKRDAVLLRAAGVGVRPFQGMPEVGEALRVTVGPWPLMERFLEALDGSFDGAEDLASGGGAT